MVLDNYYVVAFVKNLLVTQPNTGLQESFITLIATVLAILFSILITIVANSSSKYPSNFIRDLTKDFKTQLLYFGFATIMVLEVIFYHKNYSFFFVDVVLMIILLVGLYFYWRHILDFIDPEQAVGIINEKKWNYDEKTKKEIKQIGDYVTIGIKDGNQVLTNKAFDKLLEFNKELKK